MEDLIAPRATRTWLQAGAWALAIFAYFTLFTVWLPSWILHLSGVAGAPSAVRDLIGLGVWLVSLVAGMWALRRLQARGRI